jgi:hypothetical protein
MAYVELYRKELACFRAHLPILTGEKIEQRCRTLSLLLTAAVRCGEITTTQVRETCRALTPDSDSQTSARADGPLSLSFPSRFGRPF